MEGYRAAEDGLQCVIYQAFHVCMSKPQRLAVKRADLTALALEKRDLLGPCPYAWDLQMPEPPAEVATIYPDSPGEAEARFLARYWELVG